MGDCAWRPICNRARISRVLRINITNILYASGGFAHSKKLSVASDLRITSDGFLTCNAFSWSGVAVSYVTLQAKKLTFPWVSLAESGLFNALRRIQIKKSVPLATRVGCAKRPRALLLSDPPLAGSGLESGEQKTITR